MAKAFEGKVKRVLVRFDIPVPMNPNKNIYKSISTFQDRQTGNYYVGSDVPYAPVLEWGRLPGSKPPFKPILDWVIKKVLGTAIYSKSHQKTLTSTNPDPQAIRIATLIVNHIERYGTKPRRFMRIALEEAINGDWS